AGRRDQWDADQMCGSASRTDDIHSSSRCFLVARRLATCPFAIPGMMAGRKHRSDRQSGRSWCAEGLVRACVTRAQGGLMSFWSLVRRQGLINPRCTGRLSRTSVVVAFTLCSASVPHAQPTAQPPDTIEARMLACAVCHGPQGQGTNNDYFPRLAGKPAGYLL